MITLKEEVSRCLSETLLDAVGREPRASLLTSLVRIGKPRRETRTGPGRWLGAECRTYCERVSPTGDDKSLIMIVQNISWV